MHHRLPLLFSLIALTTGCVDDLASVQDEARWATQELPVHTACGSGDYLLGIDVSSWQGTIDWTQVAASGRADFAYIRIGDGMGTDSQFTRNWRQARQAGVPRGAYHYFRPGGDPAAQAQHFIDMVEGAGGYRTADLPPMIDVESTDGEGAATIRANMRVWIDAIETYTGKQPIIYTGSYFWDDHSLGAGFADYHLWTAHYTSGNCPLVPNAWDAWTIWQYTSSGSVAGIAGNVDRNRFDGTAEDLARWPECSTYKPISSCPPPAWTCDAVATLADSMPLDGSWSQRQCADTVDRASWVVLLGDALQIDQTTAYTMCQLTFSDVAVDAVYARAVAVLAALDHGDGTSVLSTPPPTFGPGGAPTRCEAMQMIAEAWQLPDDGGLALQFTDLDTAPAACVPALARATAAGIVNNNAVAFRPLDPLTANAAATWTQRAMASFGRPIPGASDFNDPTCERCTDLCVDGESQCNGVGTQACVANADGCMEWGTTVPCFGEMVCRSGMCLSPGLAAELDDSDGFSAGDASPDDVYEGDSELARYPEVASSCACRTTTRETGPRWMGVLALVGLLAVRRSRRRTESI